MSITKFLAPFLISIFLVMPSHATEIEDFMSWSQLGNGSAWIKYSSDYGDEFKFLKATIAHSKVGKQKLYFIDHYVENINACKYTTTIPDSTTMIFNGQAVKMSRWCKKFTDSNSYYFDLTPETERGHSYVVNLFKESTSPIEIQFNNERTYFPVIGFTKAWNSAGGNAI